jgi:hypothetical protein
MANELSHKSLLFFVALHKEAPLPPPCEHYVALGLGGYHPTAPRSLSDDAYDSISTKNKHYSELTGWYWIWKNISHVKLIGLNHYRRYFFLDPNHPLFFAQPKLYFTPEKHIFEYIASSERNAFVEETLSRVDVIVPRRQRLDLPLSLQYVRHHYREDWDLFIEGIKELFPQCSPQIGWFDKTFDLCPYNMMIASKEYFDVYMSSLFKLLSWMEDKRSFRMEDYQCRVPSFIAERYFTFYLHITQARYVEVPVLISERSAF